MLRKFKISIDGTEYLVEMEEIGGVQQPVAPVAPVAAEPVAAPVAPAAAPAPVAAPAPTLSGEGEPIKSPMPGTILKVLVKPGEQVKANQPLLILEAMKMENEIVAPKDGTIVDVAVIGGQVVDSSDLLLTIN
ncbi:MAG: acetyl-CoA carboxylase biotin carboxyl carrier protein subunit [Lactobacillales bacterium]|jgi:biotin carboxyl carrier protein|nr:acetyl-CoA carboxylase biotin carboxyl carrier protein subunit [Lactobacillales bacterium]